MLLQHYILGLPGIAKNDSMCSQTCKYTCAQARIAGKSLRGLWGSMHKLKSQLTPSLDSAPPVLAVQALKLYETSPFRAFMRCLLSQLGPCFAGPG